MLVIKVRKLYICVFLIISLLFAFPNNIKAEETILDSMKFIDDPDSNSIFAVVCEYTSTKTAGYKFTLVTTNDNGYKLIKTTENVVHSVTSYGASFYSLPNSKEGENIYLQQSDMDNFECPSLLYRDIGGLQGEFCMTDDFSFCKSKEGVGTNFDQEFSLTYNFESYLVKVKDYVVDHLAEEEETIYNNLVAGNSEANEAIYKRMLNNVVTFLGFYADGDDMLPFVENNELYVQIYTSLNKAFDDSYADVKNQIQNDENLSEEQKDAALESLEELSVNTNAAFNSTIQDLTGNKSTFVAPANCESLLGDVSDDGSTAYYLQMILDVMRYVAIAAVIVLTIVDYLKALASNDSDAVKKTSSKTLKRIVLAVIIFLIPVLLNYVFELVGITSDCGIE